VSRIKSTMQSNVTVGNH